MLWLREPNVGENEHADLLTKSAAQGLPLPSEVFFETIRASSVELLERAVLNISPVHSEDWRTEIISFLKGNCLSDDEAYNKRIEVSAFRDRGVPEPTSEVSLRAPAQMGRREAEREGGK